jgi:ABC-type glycerol-3-phosphate transport system substrate-binding protein
MNLIWCYGGKLVEADNKTVTLHSQGTVQAVQLLADMFKKHKIIPKGAISWDNTGNNKAYQSRQVIFVLNPTSIYAHLADSDPELYKTTGLFPIPAGPAGAIEALTSAEWVLFKKNPYPDIAKGLAEYWMAPDKKKAMGAGDRHTRACTIQISGSVRCSSIGVPCSSEDVSFPLLACKMPLRAKSLPRVLWPV